MINKNEFKYTVKELIDKLKTVPQNLKVQLDIEGELYSELEVDVGQQRCIIFSRGESDFG